MEYLFSPSIEKKLRQLAQSRPLIALDFDGTLAPIVPKPEDAQMPDTTTELMQRIVSQWPVAIISGRWVSDLKERVPVRVKHLIGNHGVEGLPGWESQSEKAEATVQKWMKHLPAAELESMGVDVEDKRFSLALHYRHAQDKDIAKREIETWVEKLGEPPRVIGGKEVINLVVPQCPHKGMAVKSLMDLEATSVALYIGDDDTDEDVFRMNQPGLMTISVGNRPNSAAQYYLNEQKEMDQLLTLLLSF